MFAEAAISVALVEDDALMRARLEQALRATPLIELACSAATAREITEWLRSNSVHVLLVDLGLPDGSGLDVIRYCRAHSPSTQVMVVTLFGDEHNMLRAFEAGAQGYLLKDGSEAELARHVASLHAGGSPMSPPIARQLLQRLAPAPSSAAGGPAIPMQSMLTEREHEILLILSRGYTYAEAARLSGIAVSTVQSHVKNIYNKLNVGSKTEAVFEARQLGLL